MREKENEITGRDTPIKCYYHFTHEIELVVVTTGTIDNLFPPCQIIK